MPRMPKGRRLHVASASPSIRQPKTEFQRGPGTGPVGEHAIEPHFEPSIGLVQDTAEGVSGPLWVRGGVEVVAADGSAYEVRNRVAWCRCGASANKPFCDGSHGATGFTDRA